MKLLYVLYKIRMLSPAGIFRLLAAVFQNGINLMALLQFAGKTYGDRVALVDGPQNLSYRELLFDARNLTIRLHKQYRLKSGQKVGVLCQNHAFLVKTIFAVSRVGADLFLLNTEMSKKQLQQLLKQHHFDLLILDSELEPEIKTAKKFLHYHEQDDSSAANMPVKLQRTSMGKLVLLTGGTTGKAKEAAHKPSLFNYLNPFLGLVTRLKLADNKTVYIATPIYHGYGAAILLLFFALGKKVAISRRFSAETACRIIREHQVEVVTVVPLMIHKMLKHRAEDLRSLACIASGGAELSPKIVAEVRSKLGDVLYNLYGTSEAGLNIIATPGDLNYSCKTIGRKIDGVRLKVLDQAKKPAPDGAIGQFCIKNSWSMKNSDWVETGDLGYRDPNGYYFLCGRTDDMIVSAGENVYPIQLEQILMEHPHVENAAVVGMEDELFGKRLKAFVQPTPEANLTTEDLYAWLKPRTARYQMPKEILLKDQLPYTPLGKLDRKRLK